MAVTGERQVTDGMAGNPQTQKSGYALVMKGFWLGDKFRIRAATRYKETVVDSVSMRGQMPLWSQILFGLAGGPGVKGNIIIDFVYFKSGVKERTAEVMVDL